MSWRRASQSNPAATPSTLVVGGTYADRVSMLSAEPLAGRTIEIESSEEVVGGPGLCLAVALRRLGTTVGLATALGNCRASERAERLLRATGVTVFTQAATSPLDRSDLYVAPSGDRVVFNTHALSRSARYAKHASAPARSARVIVIGSPTPVRQAEEIISVAPAGTLTIALLHSRQLREVAAGRGSLLRMADVVCVSTGDEPLLRGCYPDDGAVLVTTHGADGARARLGAGVEIDVPQPDVVDTRNTNGAGEAFCAALTLVLAGRSRDAAWRPDAVDMRHAIEAAHRYAAAHLRAGGNLNFPTGAVADFAARDVLASVAG
jgi:sugar/nucleoside kinase (ribokinase family)